MKSLDSVIISGREVLPLIEGGKGIAVSNGKSSGAWAAANAVGTFSGVTPDYYDENGNFIAEFYKKKIRKERHQEMIEQATRGCIAQAKIAHDVSGGKGRVHINVLWEMGGCEDILVNTLENTKGLIHGVSCGAGMPYKLASICSSYGVYYYPIVSSGRAFKALWRRSYSKHSEFLGGVVYEDPWNAGGHNGLSNNEDPLVPQDPYPRVVELRKVMRTAGLENTPIIMAGGVWNLSEWEDWIGNPDIGAIAFQLGTRPILTRESPVAEHWKNKLLTLEKNDVLLQRFSPTGFYSSAIKNDFLSMLEARSQRQVAFATQKSEELSKEIRIGLSKTGYISAEDKLKTNEWIKKGYSEALPTPDNTVVFVSKEEAKEFKISQAKCIGCLSQCAFSSWSQYSENYSSGKTPDPRSFCIHNTLMSMAHDGDLNAGLMFAGHNAHRFATDPLYQNSHIPTAQELIDNLIVGK